MSAECLTWLRIVRQSAKDDGMRTDLGAAVLGSKGIGYTIEFPDASQVYVGRQCCKYCARAKAITSGYRVPDALAEAGVS